jgi:ATP-dependent exoDNAse (exonuclease V) alpha subunit
MSLYARLAELPNVVAIKYSVPRPMYAELTRLASESGAAVRLLGDPAQLASVDAGGALSLLEHDIGAAYLTDLHRFTNPDEAEATLKLRRGDPDAVSFYEQNNRIHSGSRDAMLEAAYDAWATDMRNGRTSVLIAAANEDVTALNARGRLERVLAGQVTHEGITLHDGTTAGIGDWIVTRSNQRPLTYRRGRWVHNGDTWRITRRHKDGSLTVKRLDNHGSIRLPAEYVAESVELAYASTAHRAQGTTTETAHALVTPDMTREALYVASTRGRERTIWYVTTESTFDSECHVQPRQPTTTREHLESVIARRGAQTSAIEMTRNLPPPVHPTQKGRRGTQDGRAWDRPPSPCRDTGPRSVKA